MSVGPLIATLTATRAVLPLATVEGLPGGGADLTPAELRDLVTALARIADDAERRLLTQRGKPAPAVRRTYPLT